MHFDAVVTRGLQLLRSWLKSVALTNIIEKSQPDETDQEEMSILKLELKNMPEKLVTLPTDQDDRSTSRLSVYRNIAFILVPFDVSQSSRPFPWNCRASSKAYSKFVTLPTDHERRSTDEIFVPEKIPNKLVTLSVFQCCNPIPLKEVAFVKSSESDDTLLTSHRLVSKSTERAFIICGNRALDVFQRSSPVPLKEVAFSNVARKSKQFPTDQPLASKSRLVAFANVCCRLRALDVFHCSSPFP